MYAKHKRFFTTRHYLAAIAIALAAAFYISLNFETFQVHGASMEPSLSDGEKLFVKKDKSPKVGDLAFFYPPAGWQSRLSKNSQEGLIVKEIIAVQGDVVKFDGKNLKINDKIIWSGKCFSPNLEYKLIGGDYFVMGDNAAVSLDSRTVLCDGGPSYIVRETNLQFVGKVMFKY